MCCPREHIHGLDFFHLIPLLQIGKVPGKGLGIAGDVHHALGLVLQNKVEETLFASRSRGIGEDHIHVLLVLQRKPLVVCHDELCIGETV